MTHPDDSNLPKLFFSESLVPSFLNDCKDNLFEPELYFLVRLRVKHSSATHPQNAMIFTKYRQNYNSCSIMSSLVSL